MVIQEPFVLSFLLELPTESFGRFILPNVGYVDITDEDTLEIARSYLKILEKKIRPKPQDMSNSEAAEF